MYKLQTTAKTALGMRLDDQMQFLQLKFHTRLRISRRYFTHNSHINCTNNDMFFYEWPHLMWGHSTSKNGEKFDLAQELQLARTSL